MSNVVNVKDLGPVGDGKTDDTSSIQAAIDTGAKVLLPTGEYLLSATEASVQTGRHLNPVYTREEAYKASLEYFGGDGLAADAFLSKYALTDDDGNLLEKTPDQMHRRLAREFARIEAKYPNPLSEDEIYGWLKNFRYIVPQGSPMSGIGNPNQLQSLSNCFVIDPPQDSYGGIMKTDHDQAQIMKRRGGVGFDISTIRPKGIRTRNAARTTDGIGVFMERFSNTCREVAQGGRRGALMLTISCHHPEILTFLEIKKDKKKVTGANISVRYTDEFMEAVKNGRQVQLRFPVDQPENPLVEKWVDAQEIWNKAMEAAHDSAEPGALFWDTARNMTPADCYEQFRSISTNPCQPAFATLLTPSGIRTMGDIKVGDTVWTGERWAKVVRKLETGVKPVYRYETNAGVFIGTENHRIVQDGEKIEVGKADSIDLCPGPSAQKAEHHKRLVMDGWVLGDGSVHAASNDLVHLHIGKDDGDIFKELSGLIDKHRPGIKNTAWSIRTGICASELPKTFERSVPERYKNGTPDEVCSFLRGLYSANGSICGGRVTLKAASKEVIRDVQEMLSSVGIRSYITTNKPSIVQFENGNYECRESYDLNVTKDRQLFSDLIGFVQEYKTEKLRVACDRPTSAKKKVSYEITNTEFVGHLPVYDITVDAPEHTYWTGGLLVSNCGEIILSAYDSCRLLVLNLFGFVERPFTPDAAFNWDLYKQATTVAQRLMDDLIDLELEMVNKIIAKIEADPEDDEVKYFELRLWQKIRSAAENGRRTGLGITALGDCLAGLGVRYGDEDAQRLTEHFYRTLAVSAYKSSCQMAKERGAFPAYDPAKEQDHPFLERILSADKALREIHTQYGRRNIALTTTAPTGTVSLMTQTTSGIEPAYQVVYKRRRKINPEDTTSRVDFTDELGDKWQEYKVYHHNFKRWMEVTGKTEVEESPYHQAQALDIDWVASVDVQAAAQKWVCHAISKTCNLPKDATVDLVKEVYMRAWEKGCKGFTIYRDGSRSGVLIAEDAISVAIKDASAPPRPKKLKADIHHCKVKGQQWTIVVGLLEGRPYEVFGGLSENLEVHKKFKAGTVERNGKKDGITTYNLYFGPENTVIEDIVSEFDNPNYGAFTRTLSLLLRHGVPLTHTVEQLQKDKHSDMQSFARVMARVLKQYVADGTKSATEKSCKECGAEGSVVYQEGCLRCTNCGSSKCG